MRHWKDLTVGEIERMAQLYPHTTNIDLGRIFDISPEVINPHFARPLGWYKGHKPRVESRFERHGIDKNMQIKNYRHTLKKRGYIVERLGIEAYYTSKTNRSHIIESHARECGFTIKQL